MVIPDVEPDQVWKQGDQHVKVEAVHNGLATIQRCTAAGRVLNQRYRTSLTVESLTTNYALIKKGAFSRD
jgi:hypothetical protein